MVGIGGLSGTFVGLQFYTGLNQMHYILPGFILAGLLGVARLLLNAHSPAQVYAGFLLGFFSLIGVFLFL
jgi:membrane-associated phospholipid phosphatase